MLEKIKTQKPDLATSISIEVVPLEGVIQTLQTNNDPMLSQIVLVPSTESMQFLAQNNTTGSLQFSSPNSNTTNTNRTSRNREGMSPTEAAMEAMETQAEYGDLGTPAGFPLPIIP